MTLISSKAVIKYERSLLTTTLYILTTPSLIVRYSFYFKSVSILGRIKLYSEMCCKIFTTLSSSHISYKTMFNRLKGLKVEIEHLQLLMEKAKMKLQRDFEVWWTEEGTNLQVYNYCVFLPFLCKFKIFNNFIKIINILILIINIKIL